ncbi:diaminopimelate decarboxylase [bacterium]|nr:diaminopimelate decarboxylase [bacterium]
MALSNTQVRKLVDQFHTPLYVFEESIIRRQCQRIKQALTYPNTKVRYACKALTLGAALKIIRSEGLLIDAVSLNEVYRAINAGYTSSEILYTGESASEVAYNILLDKQVLINCSSLDQMRLIGKITPGSPCSIRLNPGEGHGKNNKVNTGGPASKHGIYIDQIEEVKKLVTQFDLKLVGLHCHIGSETDLNHWLRINDLTLSVARQFPNLEFIDLGGGIPVVYNPDTDTPMPLEEWGQKISERFAAFCQEYGKNVQLQIEPGRFIVAECGSLLAEVQVVKSTPEYNYVIVNTGLNHNIRPAMYGSFHAIRFVTHDERTAAEPKKPYVVAGYLCESGDVFTVARDGTLLPREFPELQVGDLMVMENVGAYCHSMKSEYNSMNMPAAVLVNVDGSFRVVERRGNLDDMMRREIEAF